MPCSQVNAGARLRRVAKASGPKLGGRRIVKERKPNFTVLAAASYKFGSNHFVIIMASTFECIYASVLFHAKPNPQTLMFETVYVNHAGLHF